MKKIFDVIRDVVMVLFLLVVAIALTFICLVATGVLPPSYFKDLGESHEKKDVSLDKGYGYSISCGDCIDCVDVDVFCVNKYSVFRM